MKLWETVILFNHTTLRARFSVTYVVCRILLTLSGMYRNLSRNLNFKIDWNMSSLDYSQKASSKEPYRENESSVKQWRDLNNPGRLVLSPFLFMHEPRWLCKSPRNIYLPIDSCNCKSIEIEYEDGCIYNKCPNFQHHFDGPPLDSICVISTKCKTFLSSVEN